ncbi:MAG: MerR family transcriptional regulator [Myxococcales bacterium]|nr:MerR family transcriptional regulator [Myxococcales bacterium]
MSSSRGTQLEKLYYRIGEVAGIVGVEPHVLRYWETEFRSVRPQKSARGQRIYSRRDVDTLLKVKELLYGHRFTIAGAKQKLREGGPIEPAPAPAPAAAEVEAAPVVEQAPVAAALPAPAAVASFVGLDDLRAVRDELLELRALAEGFLEELFEETPARARTEPLQRAK